VLIGVSLLLFRLKTFCWASRSGLNQETKDDFPESKCFLKGLSTKVIKMLGLLWNKIVGAPHRAKGV
jgi:hypothetical protein